MQTIGTLLIQLVLTHSSFPSATSFSLPCGSRRRSRNPHFGRKRRGQLRQRSGRNRHLTFQDGSRQTLRPVENHTPARMENHELDLLIRQRPAHGAINHQIPNEEENAFRLQKTHMIGLWPPAPDHETDFAASPSTAHYRMHAVRPCEAGFETGA